MAGGLSPAWEARGEAQYPEAVPQRIKPQTHSVPRRHSGPGRSPPWRSCSDAPERPWAPRTGGTSYGLAVRRWIGARTTTPSCLPSPSSTTRCGTWERLGRRAEGGNCPGGCGAWKQAVNDRGRQRQESLHAPFSGRFFQLHCCTPLRSLSRALPALPVIFFFMALLSCLAPVVQEPRVRINPFFQFGSFGDLSPQGQQPSSCLGSLCRDAPGSHCAFFALSTYLLWAPWERGALDTSRGWAHTHKSACPFH